MYVYSWQAIQEQQDVRRGADQRQRHPASGVLDVPEVPEGLPPLGAETRDRPARAGGTREYRPPGVCGRSAIGRGVRSLAVLARPGRRRPRRGHAGVEDHRRRLAGRLLHLGRGRALERQLDHADRRQGRHRPCLPARRAHDARWTRPGCTRRAPRTAGATAPTWPRSTAPRLPVAERIDLSCSGAVTKNIFRAADGGEGQNGEPPQADKLLPVARATDVKLIMLSIGGNDLGFASIVAACLEAYAAKTGPCQPSQQPKIDAREAQGAGRGGEGHRRDPGGDGGGRLRARGLPADPADLPLGGAAGLGGPLPRGRRQERTLNGCPFYDQDANWARDSAAGQIGNVSKAAAASRGVETLDLLNAFQGHEFCRSSTSSPRPSRGPHRRRRSGAASWAPARSSRASCRRPSTPTPTASGRSAPA